MMTLLTEPGTRRIFVSDMRGLIYAVSYDGRTVAEYLDVSDDRWGVDINADDNDRGIQSFAFHPQFSQQGTPGHGKLYTWVDTNNNEPPPDFIPSGRAPFLYRGPGLGDAGDTVLLEWTAQDPSSIQYDGTAPRELLRVQQPFDNHNGGHIAFSPSAAGDPEFGLLYVGVADGGHSSDPFNLSQDLSSVFGKILRIDPLGSNSTNGKYGVPVGNPFVLDDDNGTALGEIYAYGLRNPHRFAWDRLNGNLFVADIGQNVVEEIANLGWNEWEGSFEFLTNAGLSIVSSPTVAPSSPRSDPNVTYPVAEYDHQDALFQSDAAVTGVHIYRESDVPQLSNLLIFGDLVSGEIFYVSADSLPGGGQNSIHRILFADRGRAKTLLQLSQETNEERGRAVANRADMRFGEGPEGQLLVINKADGVIRQLVP